ncbi:hypothetical protein [Terrihabitans rhizophilus]|uniref:NACHT domain-containing protein n=1 Tax=Terrihabitans rhizophilus TaxID=3092662 RepID=A0ABU4RPF5_9HYPH|nr:hypothetical protein [Terrihabitans sp. PJ23]MDX6806742.1 hypothetical protein [Terrihabitans sp. PJ23]
MNAKNPERLIPPGNPLLIDGLDEAMSRGEGDAIDAILAQLEAAGAPSFILSCRSREWQARSVTNLRQLYGADPKILTLQPFDFAEARAYLVAQHPTADAEHVLDHLAAHNLDELCRNPLTLGLMGRVAESDTNLPATRAALFERVCALVWPEHDADRQDYGLAQLAEDEALDAAGAISASLLFAGAEAASTAGAAHVQQSDLRLVDLEKLPQAQAVRSMFSSKLFHSAGPSRARPIHRVVAEFLGSRWLSRQAPSPRVQRRVLAQLHGSGGVPASLRGLHAWLAYHSPSMSRRVISADPYGILRYGEPAALTPQLADCLFEALCVLAEDDPYFRSADWDSKTAAGLMIPTLKAKIQGIIDTAGSSVHLRSLLIEGLKGTPLAADLADTLESVVLSQERCYREREDAAKALLPHRERKWWRSTIAILTNQAGSDAPRLARQLIQHIDADVSDEVIVATLFAEMGVTSCTLPRRTKRQVQTVRRYRRLVDAIPSSRRSGLIDLIVDYAELLREDDWRSRSHVADIVAQLLTLAIDDGGVCAAQAPVVWRWLGVIEHAHSYDNDVRQTLADRLAKHDPLRRAIHAHVMDGNRGTQTLLTTAYYLKLRLVGLSAQPGDIAYALGRLAQGDTRNLEFRQEWMELVRRGWRPDGLDPDIRAASEAFRRGDKVLEDFLRQLESPKKPSWIIKQEQQVAKRDRKRRVEFETG